MYTHYVGNFDKATETLSLWTKKSPVLAALIDEIQVSLKIHIVLVWYPCKNRNICSELPSLSTSFSLPVIFSENQRVWTLDASASYVGTSPESSQIPVTSERLISGTWLVNSPVSSNFFCTSGRISLWMQPVVVSLCWKRQCEQQSKIGLNKQRPCFKTANVQLRSIQSLDFCLTILQMISTCK